MTVSNRQLSILAAVAVAMAALTLVLYGYQGRPAASFQKGTLLIQGLDLGKVATITLAKGDKTLTLERKDKGFTVAERNHYPASVKKVNDLLIKCLEARADEKATTDPANFAQLAVADDPQALLKEAKEAKKKAEQAAEKAKATNDEAAAREAKKQIDDADKAIDDAERTVKVTLADKDGQPIVALIVGKSASRSSGDYVRLAGQDTVYASEKGLYLTADPTDYMETALVDVPKDDVQEVKVALKDASYTIARDKDDKIVLQDVPKEKRAKDSEVESVFGALSSVSFRDVVPAAKADVKWDAKFTCQTKKHITYTAEVGKKGGKDYVKLAAEGPSPELIRQSMRIGETEPKKELEKKDAVLSAARKAEDFNVLHGAWAYELSDWTAGKLAKPLADLVEDIPKPSEPEEISASHILISYKGAEKADAKITRTKDEAKKLAEEVLKKAQAEGADFAALAKEHSDGPTKTKGGDLGSFKKGVMAKAFEEAAWKLEVGKISEVVETPFGFHIIKRTK